MSETPQAIPPAALPHGGKNRYQEMARASWLAPLIAVAVNFLFLASQGGKVGTSNKVQMISGPLFIIGGLLLGFGALAGIRKHGTQSFLKCLGSSRIYD